MEQSETSVEPKKPLVGIICGSPNDLKRVGQAASVLNQLSIPNEIKVLSAHRTPGLVNEYIATTQQRGIRVLIACAGLANHLAGTVAAKTLLPVIGVPLNAGSMGGLDALLSTVQMPPGIPVATMGIDAAKNAAYMAARILSLIDPEISERLEAELEAQRKQYEELNKTDLAAASS